MEANPRTVESYIAPNDAIHLMIGWLNSKITKAKRKLSEMVSPNLKIDFGPGYRVYCVDDGKTVLLLCGGTKRTQDADIAKAKYYWREYRS